MTLSTQRPTDCHPDPITGQPEKGFTVRDKREERRIAEEAAEQARELISAGVDRDLVLQAHAETVDAMKQAATATENHPETQWRIQQIARVEILCGHCKKITSTDDQAAAVKLAQGGAIQGKCQTAGCGKPFELRRARIAIANTLPNRHQKRSAKHQP